MSASPNNLGKPYGTIEIITIVGRVIKEGRTVEIKRYLETIEEKHQPCILNAKNRDGNNSLHLAILNKCPMVLIRYLVERGAKIDIRDEQKRNSLHLAIKAQNHDALAYLLKHREVDPEEKDNKNRTPFLRAAQQKDLFSIIILLESDAKRENGGGIIKEMINYSQTNPRLFDAIIVHNLSDILREKLQPTPKQTVMTTSVTTPQWRQTVGGTTEIVTMV